MTRGGRDGIAEWIGPIALRKRCALPLPVSKLATRSNALVVYLSLSRCCGVHVSGLEGGSHNSIEQYRDYQFRFQVLFIGLESAVKNLPILAIMTLLNVPEMHVDGSVYVLTH